MDGHPWVLEESTIADASSLSIAFSLRGLSGLIAVSVTPNTDPDAVGYSYDMDWQAHSFLCVSPDAVITRQVQAIAGFSWGFTIKHQDITFAEPAPIGPQAWDSHLDLLSTSYPDWTFDRGYLPAD